MKVLNNRFVQLGGALLIGGIIGVTFYPTKIITEKIKKEYQEQIISLKEEHKATEQKSHDKYVSELSVQAYKLEEINKTLNVTRIENSSLRSKMKERTLKIIKPDGTIVEETYKESETEQITKVVTEVREEFIKKVQSIETRYQKIHLERIKALVEKWDSKESDYQQRIAKYESEKRVEINPKKLGFEIGAKSDKYYYIHPTYDIVGPIFLGGDIARSFDGTQHTFGVGIGIRF